MSFSIAEDEIRILGAKLLEGHYASWTYFQSIENKMNKEFVRRFKDRYGPDRVTGDPIEAAYSSVHLWAGAVEQAGSDNVHAIRRAVMGKSMATPGGMVYIDPENQHTWKTVRIGRIRKDGQFDIVWSSVRPISPVPYPDLRPRAEWETFLERLYKGWGGQWANPDTSVD